VAGRKGASASRSRWPVVIQHGRSDGHGFVIRGAVLTLARISVLEGALPQCLSYAEAANAHGLEAECPVASQDSAMTTTVRKPGVRNVLRPGRDRRPPKRRSRPTVRSVPHLRLPVPQKRPNDSVCSNAHCTSGVWFLRLSPGRISVFAKLPSRSWRSCGGTD
jgi:hypothetical protein